MSQYYLVDYALKNIWCAPEQDKQMIIEPAKLTAFGGVWNMVDILGRTYTLPEPEARFHVYMIGQLHPMLMGLFPARKWMSVAENCNIMKMVTDIYSEKGIEFPRFETWYMVTEDKNLIFALKEQDVVPINIDVDKIFVRVYTNAYFHSIRRLPDAHGVEVVGKRIKNTQEILDMQIRFQEFKSRTYGRTYGYVNGMFVSDIDMITVAVGDVVEMLYDSSIKRVVDFKVQDLNDFNSWLDSKRKYLLHYSGEGDKMIDFQDDIDIHLIKPMQNNRFRGIYFHKNAVDAMRMVTHKDYSIPVQLVVAFAEGIQEWNDPNELVVRLHIRHSGFQRPLVFEANRIHELYKLEDVDVERAMLGIDSTVPNWRAENMEGSDYTALMRSQTSCVSRELVQGALGYNAISHQVGYTPRFTYQKSSQTVADVSYALQQGSTAYEYDVNGTLINWYNHGLGSIYAARNSNCKLVEQIGGITSDRLDEVYGLVNSEIDPTASYRFYTCPIINGVPSNQWEDVTGSDLYAINNNKVTWFVDMNSTYTLVRSNKINLGYRQMLTPVGGVLKFSLKHRSLREGTLGTRIMQIPMGELDIFLNGKSLIENIDYKVNFPEIVIFTKEYFTDDPNGEQWIEVRFTGFCKKDLTREPINDVGWVNKDQLSRNNRYDIRDDKVLRITAGGATYDRSELRFAETSGVVFIAGMNGKPYQIRDIVVPVGSVTPGDTYALRAESQIIDKRVSDYMTLKLPQQPSELPNPILNPYQLYSPFVCKIMYDLKDDILTSPKLYEHFSDQDVKNLCEEYEYLLKFDPTQPANQLPDMEYVSVHPHNLPTAVELNVWKYRFLSRVVELYSNGFVKLSHFISITV